MPLTQPKKISALPSSALVGTFTKKEAALRIAGGCAHLHSTELGKADTESELTRRAVSTSEVPTYTWEATDRAKEKKLGSSTDRAALIQQVVNELGIEHRQSLRLKVESVLEELLTNAIYHGYRVHGGEEKYRRRSVVTLLTDELVSLSYARGESGLYLRVCDQAGTLGFSEVAESLRRCYESLPQVQQKEGGAGLGTYMVFDAITHIKFECIHGKSTTISCWLADHKTFQPDVFSFNFFEKGPEE